MRREIKKSFNFRANLGTTSHQCHQIQHFFFPENLQNNNKKPIAGLLGCIEEI